ncbi:hypothetical protein M0812_02776 [Anaeramoeba flamelloides]|uniref:Uncharacterized protein n=1 Tax=Anaeramoeba flamelloides TaxID=1746091 RepID=A0AAV7YRM3_9EUKA|nr:hypothetical protein M0812_02776 [Anaeramoeba flamelloides]
MNKEFFNQFQNRQNKDFKNRLKTIKKVLKDYKMTTNYLKNKYGEIREKENTKIYEFVTVMYKSCCENEKQVIGLLTPERTFCEKEEEEKEIYLNAEKRKKKLKKVLGKLSKFIKTDKEYHFVSGNFDQKEQKCVEEILDNIILKYQSSHELEKNNNRLIYEDCQNRLYPSHFIENFWREDLDLTLFHPTLESLHSDLEYVMNPDQTVEFKRARLGKYPLWKTKTYIAFPLRYLNDIKTPYVAKFLFKGQQNQVEDFTQINNILCKGMIHYTNKIFFPKYLNEFCKQFNQKYLKEDQQINFITSNWGYFLKYREQPMIIQKYYLYTEQIPKSGMFTYEQKVRSQIKTFNHLTERVILLEWFLNSKQNFFEFHFKTIYNQKSIKKMEIMRIIYNEYTIDNTISRALNPESQLFQAYVRNNVESEEL